MHRIVPIISSMLMYADIISASRPSKYRNVREVFARKISEFIQLKNITLTNSGISAFYLILKMLRDGSSKREVILPAYTAGSLVTAVLRAGLEPKLCDVSLGDFNVDCAKLLESITKNTIAVVCVHMFGIGIEGIVGLREKINDDSVLIEDCAQSFGSKIDGKNTGAFSDISFYSFNRGKNLPTYGGGCIGTNSRQLAEKIEEEVQKLPEQNLLNKLSIPVKIFALSLAVRPLIYGLIYPFASHFKDVSLPNDFKCEKITNFQAVVGLILLKKLDELSLKRHQNGMFLIDSLKSFDELILPNIENNSQLAFNRLPVVFKDLRKLKLVEMKLWNAGIETSRMYLKPLHYMFDLGYRQDDFPNATYFAEHLLTLPTHPLVTQKDLDKMVETIKKT